MHGLLSLFRLLRIATPDALRITILRDQFHWLARLVFLDSVSASLGVAGSGGMVWIDLERFVSIWDRLGTVWNVLGALLSRLGSVLGAYESVQERISVWECSGNVLGAFRRFWRVGGALGMFWERFGHVWERFGALGV